MNKSGRNKFKTLPDQASSKQEQFAFQSQSDDSHIKTINLASPTFATNDLESIKNQSQMVKNNRDPKTTQKQNKITLCLKQMRLNDVVNQNRDSKEKENNIQSSKKNDNALLRAQNQKLEKHNKQLEQQNDILTRKLQACKLSLTKKFNQAVKFLQMDNSSPTQSNTDIYLQLKAFKKHYKQLNQACQQYQKQINILMSKIHELEQIITNYTEKSEKKKFEREEAGQKVKNIERQYHEQFQQFKRKSQIKFKQYELQMKQKDKTVKKSRDDYEKLKFLKQQIQKKRHEDIKIREDLQSRLKQKQFLCNSLKQQLLNLQEQHNSLNNKYLATNRSSENIQQQLNKCQQQLTKTHLSLISLQAQNNKCKLNLQNCKLVNEKYSQQLTELRKQNQVLYESAQTLKLDIDRLQSVISKHSSTQQRQNKKINLLQQKLNQVEKELDQARFQLQQISKNSERNYPNISKFKDQQQGSQKQLTYRDTESQKNALCEEAIKNTQQKFNKIIQELNEQISKLRKHKQHIENQLQVQRSKNQKINIELQNTYRKMQEFGYTQDLQKQALRGDFKQKDRMMRRDFYGMSQVLPTLQFTRATKVTPQLKMIRQILMSILGCREPQKQNFKSLGIYKEKQRQSALCVQSIIDEIKNMAQETADLFDDRCKQIQCLLSRIQNKQDVISKILRFTPQEKKPCILQYLKVMQNIEEYSVDQVYKVNKSFEQQASQWRRRIANLVQSFQESQRQNAELRKQIMKFKNQGSMRYQVGYEGGRNSYGAREKERYQRDRYQQEKYEYGRRY